ncbi:MAG: hypothetical protein IPP57_09135 [Candidatus Obscuribacter sp.]|nr:hypothetical protein [Candidatus Obscuribacter sp.]
MQDLQIEDLAHRVDEGDLEVEPARAVLEYLPKRSMILTVWFETLKKVMRSTMTTAMMATMVSAQLMAVAMS